jgi:hypothetical protein
MPVRRGERAPVAHTESDDEESVVAEAGGQGPDPGPPLAHGGGGHRRVKLAVEEVRLPAVAWPTVALGLASASVWAAGAYTGAVLGWPVVATLPVQSAAAFAVFTPMHDASHGAAAPRVRWLNGTIGRLGAFILGAPFPAYRHVHMKHHKYTNDPERDPDYWSGSGPVLLLPFKWASQVSVRARVCMGERGGGAAPSDGKGSAVAVDAHMHMCGDAGFVTGLASGGYVCERGADAAGK